MSDRIGRRGLIVYGMITQAIAIWWILIGTAFWWWTIGAVLLGVGTAMVYPTLQAALGDVAHPTWRASSMGVYRFWRDSGYAFGALFAGLLTDMLNINWAIGLVAIFPLIAGINLYFRMSETLKQPSKS
ncbi:hypothetical protein AJ85_00920 [Alkalihalobacillus alcalophilus ATCC 27647 = CGMCC 1.3604]|uniref:Major facilitator superfamily (MFS) profile domain-containing protein n=1 Tax=Alkalihalobacillus alcalophilus ATCC 27647 = CGMCC 1.3604 TaxID=1218173 RepID=A0A094WLB1_ALKAL|nr:MFS transporter [Alkalihalobacillus alcalophilus]KGA96718.1 hypothetical protein BALCAV_0214565 [Alkalihalobacillus alcalophilus ATCC 27647 = CGMCC 1.3604]THG91891.1 hypothetical protein AJ85_00920 [Alkalihalobacillus alcalophilus ATCC 27647 = CGMCC 1.3604]